MSSVVIDSRAIRRGYIALGFANTLLIGAYAAILTGLLAPGLVSMSELDPAYQLNLSSEGVFAVWYGSALHLLISVVATLNFWADHARRASGQRARFLRFGWLLLAAGTLALSADETSQFHEGIGILAGREGGVSVAGVTDASPLFAWVIVLGPPLLLAAAYLAAFFGYWLARVRRAQLLGIGGLAFWAVVPLLEITESRLGFAFGHQGLVLENLIEEAFEVVGATMLLIAALESLVASGEPDLAGPDTRRAARRRSRLTVVAGVAMPLILVPGVALGVLVKPDLRARLFDSGYHLSAARVARVMETAQNQGHYLLLGEGCDVARFKEAFPYQTSAEGAVSRYPAADVRSTSAAWTVTLLELRGDGGAELSSGLERIALRSTELWYLSCGAMTDTDRTVDRWLYDHFTDVERREFPGPDRLVLERVTPPLPLRDVAALSDARPSPHPFGDGQIELISHAGSVQETEDGRVLRLRLAWEKQLAVSRDLHVFTHVVGPDGTLLSQSDGVPVYDRYPFRDWLLGELVVDAYDVGIPAGFTVDQLRLRIGLYDFASGERLSAGASDFVEFPLAP